MKDGSQKEVLLTRLPIHFDTPENHLNAADYLVAVKSTETILNELNKRIFEGILEYEFVVFESESGSFKGVTGILVKKMKTLALIGGFLSFAELDSVKGLLEGLTGYKINYEEISKDAGIFLRQLVIGFFTIENDKLEKIIPVKINLDKAFKAKTEFYAMCTENRKISAIGFTDTENFPVQRHSFANHMSKDRIRPADSDFVVCDATIVSPITVDVDRVWRFTDRKSRKSISAYMRDEYFKNGFLSGAYPLKQSRNDDYVTMLIEYKKQERNGEIEVKEVCIHTVYTFNDMEIVPMPENQTSGFSYTSVDTLPMDRLWG